MVTTISALAARRAATAMACASVSILTASILMTVAAEAACTPAASSNVTAVCTGTTAGGYGGVGFNNLNVTVETGATVSGVPGILFNTGSLTNRGIVDGG